MKKLFIASILILAVMFVKSQPAQRVSAFNYLKYGELDKAKEAIDLAIKHEKTMGDPKTWWYYGKIYQSIQSNKKFKALDADAAQKAYDGYVKALALNFKDPANHTLDIKKEDDAVKFIQLVMNKKTQYVDMEITGDIIGLQFPSLANSFVNKGVSEFKETKNYDASLKSFENALFLASLGGKIDTPVIYYAAMSAEKAGKLDDAIKYYDQVTKFKYGKDEKEKASMYYFLSQAYKSKGDTVKYVSTVKKGIDMFPKGNTALVTELINYYLTTKKSTEALNYLKVAMNSDPTNSTYYFATGSLYDTYLQKTDSADFFYKKALEIKPDYFDAQYNLGALYYNKGAALIEKANNEKDQKKYEAIKKEAEVEFDKSLPLLEKALELNPTDVPTISSLKQLYYRKQNMPKYEEMKAKLSGK